MAKEFKPIAPKDLSGELKTKVNEIQDHWQNDPVVKNFHGPWKEYIAWLEGDQYTYYSIAKKELIDISDQVPREKKNVYNRILPMIRQQIGDTRYPHTFYVDPNTDEPDDVKAAKLGSSIIEYTNLTTFGKFLQKLNTAKWWSFVCGDAFWKEWWNKDKWGYIADKKDGKDGIGKEGGNLDFDYINPFNVRPDPYGLTRDSWRHFIEGKRLPSYIVEQEFKLKPGSLPEEKLDGADTGLFERTDEEKPKEGTTIRLEYHEKKSSTRPQGRFMVIAGGWLLYDGDNPTPEAAIPYFNIPGIIPILNKQWHESAVHIIQDAQRQFNRLGSRVDEQIEHYRAKAIIPTGALREGEFERYVRSGVEYVEINPGFGEPHWQDPPALPEMIMRWLTFMENELETQSSVRKTSLGQLPKYAQRASGVLFQGLKAQDTSVLLPQLEEMNVSLQDAMSLRLQIAQKHFSVARLVKSTGKSKESVKKFIKGTDLKGNSDVRVKEGVEMFSNREARQEVIMTFVEKGLFQDPRKALEMMDMKGLEQGMEDEFIDERQAYRENEKIKEGKITPKVDPDDNHEIHFDIHNNERKKEEFETWPDKSKENLAQHMSEHKRLMEEAKASETAAAAPPEEGAALPGEASMLPEGGAPGSQPIEPGQEAALAEMILTGGKPGG